MATPHAVLPHALEHSATARPSADTRAGHAGWLRSGLLLGVTAALTFTVLPGTASAEPDEVTDPAQITRLVADAEHELEVVTEQLNEAKVQLEKQQAAVASAQQAAADAQAQLDALDGQVRQLARSAYTTEGFSRLDVLLTSDSADELVHQLGTLDAIAGHTNQQVALVGDAADTAEQAQAEADKAQAEAQRAVDEIAEQQKDLEAQIADYQRQFAALTPPQQEAVAQAHGGTEAQVVPSGVVAPSGAAQVAVDTALAQVGDPYVWGAGGPNSFDCSGLTQYAYSAAGVSLPHSSKSQSQMGTPVSVGDLQPGDLLFYYSPTSHVAMYVGNGKMVHASTSSKPVMVVDFNSMSGFTHARRIAG
ncbi:C40 family peptidase [Blastococcus mobilis]|uniref:Cell wall-associated hydrolase, NlpC family n=1 Tax=Blastococcus mobilis TaxID=1938746 RepID=A0A238VJE6_9ACTN|nr:NlpC/P60 family protein [Blastococcus mobilis]SNR34294.1 Cell wall-associated hydrolase, NlpC family [Blastococcus mobilis]